MKERRTREEWIEAAANALAQHGISGVKVERLARELGVTKGSFYWHFVDRQSLLDAVLAAWSERGTAAIIEEVEASGGDADAKLRRLWRAAVDAGDQAFELALRDWGRRDEAVRAAILDVDTRRMGYLRRLIRQLAVPPHQVEARCLLMYSLLIGDRFVHVRHGRKSRARVLQDALDVILG